MSVYPGRGLHGEVVEKIGLRILTGVYPPGMVLFVEDLERELGVSKTVVREALKVLGAKGLVDSRPKRGTLVRPRTAWSLLDPDLLLWRQVSRNDPGFLRDLSEVRFIVEPEGARLAALRCTLEDLSELEQALANMDLATDAGDGAAFTEADLAFHRVLLLSAHNELLAQMEIVIEVGLRLRDQTVHSSRNWPDPMPVHRAILDAVRAGQAELAAAATRAMLGQSVEDISATGGHANERYASTRSKEPAASRDKQLTDDSDVLITSRSS